MRILVVEDEPKIAKSIAKAIRTEGHAVDIEYNGDSAYAMASTEPYSALIIDRMIPGEYDGVQLVRQLRKEGIYTPTLLLTALSSVANKAEGLDSGADDYLTKPFAVEELLARVRALLRRPAEQKSAVIHSGLLEIDTNKRTVTYDKNPIELTHKEYSLLEYLLRNKGTTMSKDNIIENVWDFDSDILPNTVEVHIKYLRQKIDIPYDTKIIKTSRGFGYQIEDD